MNRHPSLSDFEVRVPWGAMILSAVVASQLVTAGFLMLCWSLHGGCQFTAASANVASLW